MAKPEFPTCLDYAAGALARLVGVVLGCAIAVTLYENINLLRTLSEV